MKVSLESLRRGNEPVALVIHSLELALYQVLVKVGDEEALLTEDNGRILRRHSLNAAREALQGLPVSRLTLRHSSAYDEMIGQPAREQSNAMEVPLALETWAPLTPETGPA